MGAKDSNYKVIYRGEKLGYFTSGDWVFFQRSVSSGGGFWFGRTYEDCFWLEFHRPCALSEGIRYLLTLNTLNTKSTSFDDDFQLFE